MVAEDGASAVEDGGARVLTDVTVKADKGISEEEAIEFSREIQENAGQISEILKEEEGLVVEFFNSLLKILKKFGKSLEISPSSIPKSYGKPVSRAFLYPDGQLILVHENAEADLLNLREQGNHEILVSITGEIMMELKTLINSFKANAEKRVKFLLSITKELQKVAKVFAEK